jgi:DnaK suppressor protein
MLLTKEQADEMHALLACLREDTIAQIESLTEASRPVNVDGAIGRVTRTDALQQQQTALASLHRARERLAFVESALRRLDAGNFGECVSCGEAIPWERLKVKPDATICMECVSSKGRSRSRRP